MSTYKIRLITGPTEDTFYRHLNVPRESYVDITDTKRIILKNSGTKWKSCVPAKNPDYVEERKNLISGLVFSSRKDAETFMRDRKSALKRLAESNPTYKRYEIFTISKRFMPDSDKLKYWTPKK